MNLYKYLAKASVPGRYLMAHKARIINRRRAMRMRFKGGIKIKHGKNEAIPCKRGNDDHRTSGGAGLCERGRNTIEIKDMRR